VTGLLNRAGLREQLDGAFRAPGARGRAVCVFWIELGCAVDGPSGGEVDDRILVAAAARLRHALRPDDVLARLGGSVFCALSCDVDTPSQARAIAARLHDALDAPFQWSGLRVEFEPRVGHALAGRDRSRPDDLLTEAQTAST
jgi:diguanylate cyclase (GGDEF)-like protein